MFSLQQIDYKNVSFVFSLANVQHLVKQSCLVLLINAQLNFFAFPMEKICLFTKKNIKKIILS